MIPDYAWHSLSQRWLLGKVLVIPIKSWALPIHILFEIPILMNITLILFCFLSLSFIAKGLAICRLGGMIITQKVLFCTLFTMGFERFLHSNQSS